MITQLEEPATEEIVVHKHRSDASALSGATVETSSGLTRGTRAIVTPKLCIPKKKKYIKFLAIYPPIKVPIPNEDLKSIGLKKY